jgi:hypothetical protein
LPQRDIFMQIRTLFHTANSRAGAGRHFAW